MILKVNESYIRNRLSIILRKLVVVLIKLKVIVRIKLSDNRITTKLKLN